MRPELDDPLLELPLLPDDDPLDEPLDDPDPPLRDVLEPLLELPLLVRV